MTAAPRVRLGIVGLVHAHVYWLLAREPRGDIEIVGIAEANRDLAARYAVQHGYPMGLVHDSLDAMLDAGIGIKINMVPLAGFNEDEIDKIVAFLKTLSDGYIQE